MSVDKTAEAILAWSIDRNEYVRNPNDVEQSAYISDLQAMAKLWLMWDEIRDHLKLLVETGDPYEIEDEAVLLKKIEELEDSDE